jgi:hypothetical protein
MQRDQAQKQLELLKRIAVALEKSKAVTHADVHNAKYNKDIPGFEGTLDALDVLCDIRTITDEYATLNQSNEDLIKRHKTKLSSEFHNNLGTSNKELHELKLHTDEGQSCDDDDVHNDYLIDLVKEMSKEQYVKFFLDMDFGFALSDTTSFNNHIYDLGYEEVLDCIKSARNILDTKDPYTYDNNLREHRNFLPFPGQFFADFRKNILLRCLQQFQTLSRLKPQ